MEKLPYNRVETCRALKGNFILSESRMFDLQMHIKCCLHQILYSIWSRIIIFLCSPFPGAAALPRLVVDPQTSARLRCSGRGCAHRSELGCRSRATWLTRTLLVLPTGMQPGARAHDVRKLYYSPYLFSLCSRSRWFAWHSARVSAAAAYLMSGPVHVTDELTAKWGSFWFTS